MRRAARRDGIEPACKLALQRAGFSTEPISMPGIPDLLVWRKGTNWLRLMEIKSPGAEMKPAQAKFRERYDGPPVLTATGPNDAVRQAQASYRESRLVDEMTDPDERATR